MRRVNNDWYILKTLQDKQFLIIILAIFWLLENWLHVKSDNIGMQSVAVTLMNVSEECVAEWWGAAGISLCLHTQVWPISKTRFSLQSRIYYDTHSEYRQKENTFAAALRWACCGPRWSGPSLSAAAGCDWSVAVSRFNHHYIFDICWVSVHNIVLFFHTFYLQSHYFSIL